MLGATVSASAEPPLEEKQAQAEAILAWFDLHGATMTGEVPFREWPGAMRGHFIARIPRSHG